MTADRAADFDTDLAETDARLAPRVGTMQIINAALVAGVLMMGVIFAALTATRGPEPDPAGEVAEDVLEPDAEADAPLLSYLGLGFATLAKLNGAALPVFARC